MNRSWLLGVGVLCCVVLVCVRRGGAANPPPAAAGAAAPATRPSPADERLTFLTLQLSSTEESIKAINTALKVAGYRAAVAEDRAATAERGNELMDRKGGAPVAWDKFYGRTAQDFIAPLPPGSYLFKHKGPGPITYPTNDPLRRPPQFDYLYRANGEQAAKAKRQVEAMGRKTETLLARRRQLEDEQVSLWATIALEMIGNREIAARPLYRFHLKPGAAAPTAADEARAEIIRAAAVFVRTADRAAANAAEAVGPDPADALKSLRETLVPADAALRDTAAAQQDAAAPPGTTGQEFKELLAAAKRAALVSKNVADAHRLALDGDAAGDEPRKQMFRGQLQDSLLDLADATAELDAHVTALAGAWDVRPEAGVDAKYRLPGPVSRTETPERKPSRPSGAGAEPPAPAAASTAITVHASTKVNVLALERGAPRLYDSNPLRRIEGFDGSLAGWQFVSIPQRVVITYAVHVNKPCTLYAFGKAGDLDQVFGRERSKWEPAGGAIVGKNVGFALRRRVTAGDDLTFGGFEVQLAAETIELKTGGASPASHR
jgi:hypothetical protein